MERLYRCVFEDQRKAQHEEHFALYTLINMPKSSHKSPAHEEALEHPDSRYQENLED
jgi:hypothetical protein